MTDLLDGLPSSLRIGPFDVAVIVRDVIDDDDKHWGQYNPAVSIELRRDQRNAQGALDTVLHEIAHGICGVFELAEGESRDEERICSAFAAGFAMVMRDNPQLMAWIYRMIQPQKVV